MRVQKLECVKSTALTTMEYIPDISYLEFASLERFMIPGDKNDAAHSIAQKLVDDCSTESLLQRYGESSVKLWTNLFNCCFAKVVSLCEWPSLEDTHQLLAIEATTFYLLQDFCNRIKSNDIPLHQVASVDNYVAVAIAEYMEEMYHILSYMCDNNQQCLCRLVKELRKECQFGVKLHPACRRTQEVLMQYGCGVCEESSDGLLTVSVWGAFKMSPQENQAQQATVTRVLRSPRYKIPSGMNTRLLHRSHMLVMR